MAMGSGCSTASRVSADLSTVGFLSLARRSVHSGFSPQARFSPLWSLLLSCARVCSELGDLSHPHLPLVKHAKSQGNLEVDSILATFGLSFITVAGLLQATFGGST